MNESSPPELDGIRRASRTCRMTTNATVHDLFEPVLTLAEFAATLIVSVPRESFEVPRGSSREAAPTSRKETDM